MDFLLRKLWIIPLTVHAAYFTATIRFFPDRIGSTQGGEITCFLFALEWIAIAIVSNSVLFAVSRLMPRFSDRTLNVPNRQYWLQDGEHRNELVEMLQNMMETVMTLINIFYLGIYQWVYQTNVMVPVLKVPFMLLIAGFVTFPLALIFVYMAGLIRNLKKPNR